MQHMVQVQARLLISCICIYINVFVFVFVWILIFAFEVKAVVYVAVNSISDYCHYSWKVGQHLYLSMSLHL